MKWDYKTKLHNTKLLIIVQRVEIKTQKLMLKKIIETNKKNFLKKN